MLARSRAEIDGIGRSVDRWRKLSDNLFKVGPLKAGLDGTLTLIPVVGGLYSLGAGGFLMMQAVRAHASKGTLAKIAALLGADTLVGEIPLVGDLVDIGFRAHARAARTLEREIARTHYVEDSRAMAELNGRHQRHQADMRAAGKKRLVFLHPDPVVEQGGARSPAIR